jgi:hypothetical protein
VNIVRAIKSYAKAIHAVGLKWKEKKLHWPRVCEALEVRPISGVTPRLMPVQMRSPRLKGPNRESRTNRDGDEVSDKSVKGQGKPGRGEGGIIG